jgi:hypothetical protein
VASMLRLPNLLPDNHRPTGGNGKSDAAGIRRPAAFHIYVTSNDLLMKSG